jgi:rRNA maturation protein Nop10
VTLGRLVPQSDDCGTLDGIVWVSPLSMSVGVKAICLEVASVCFMVCGIVFFPSQIRIAEALLMSGVVCGAWSITLKCPRCGRSIRFRPLKWFHDFPMYDGSPLYAFRRRCRSCGYDLRAPSNPTHRQHRH